MMNSRFGWAGLFAVLALACSTREVVAEDNYFGSQQVSPQAPAVATASCIPSGCIPSIDIPADCIVPNPNPAGPGGDQAHAILICNACPVPEKTYVVHKVYYVWYKIENKNVPYDKIEVKTYPIPKVCSADAPCPPCVAAGGYGKAAHAGSISDEKELMAIKQTLPPPGAQTVVSSVMPQPPTPAQAMAPAAPPAQAMAPVTAPAPVKSWVWLPQEGVYGYGYQRADGLWEIDPNSRTATLPQPAPTVSMNR